MRKCSKCGEMVPDDANFCPSCGAPVAPQTTNHDTQQRAPQPDSAVYRPDVIDVHKEKKNKGRGRRIIPILALIVAAFIVLFVAASKFGLIDLGVRLPGSKPVINLENYVQIKFEGYDGNGYVSDDYPTLDQKALQREMDKVAKDHQGSADEIAQNVTLELAKDGKLIDAKTKNLSNGEVITVRLDYDADTLQDICPEINFTGSSKDEEVDLKVLTPIDPFEDYHPTFDGISPYGHVDLDISVLSSDDASFVGKCYTDYGTLPFDFYLNDKKVDADTYVAVGDTLEMRLNDNGRATLEEEGLTCDSGKKTKEYKITLADFDQGQYVTDPAKIDEDTASAMQDRTTATAKACAADYEELKTPALIGKCILSVKEGIDSDDYQHPYTAYVYSIEDNDPESDENSETPQTHYILVNGPAIVEQVENHGKEDVLKNPGNTIQSFDKDEDAFSSDWYDEKDDLKLSFQSLMDTYDLNMDSGLKEALNWTD